MAEVRTITAGEKLLADSDHILIERVPSGRYSANGSVAAGKDATFWTPPAFDSLEEAISHACVWADANGVPVVYVSKDGE